MVQAVRLRAALCRLRKAIPAGATTTDYKVTNDAFACESDLKGFFTSRDGVYTCPIVSKDWFLFFAAFVGDGPGGDYDGSSPESGDGGAVWRKCYMSIQWGAADAGLRAAVQRQLRRWRRATDRGKNMDALDETEQWLYQTGVVITEWLDSVVAKAKRVDDLYTSCIHVMVYGYNKKNYKGGLHVDARLRAVARYRLKRLIVPAADCNDRDLLFVAANGRMGRGRYKNFFSFKRHWTRIVGVARGAVLMDAVGAGALPLLPAGFADLSGDGDHLSAEEVRFLHAAFATTNASGGRGLEAGDMAVSIVFSGHPKKRRRGDEGMRLL
jgi:hypothetical protein